MKAALLAAFGVLLVGGLYLLIALGGCCLVSGWLFIKECSMMENKENIPTIKELVMMYNEDPEFREYVGRFMEARKKTLDEALECRICAYKAMDIKGELKVGDSGKL